MKQTSSHIVLWAYKMSCMLILVCSLVSCGWNGSQEVIAEAEKIDKAEHIIYDDTAALGGVIRKLDNPMGRLFYKNTLGKAYYYMGRNLEDSYYEIAEAARPISIPTLT